MDAIAIDKYITSIPEDDFTPWCEQVYDSFTEEFYYDEAYQEHVGWENSELENQWLNQLFNKEKEPEEAARIIERAWRFYHLEDHHVEYLAKACSQCDDTLTRKNSNGDGLCISCCYDALNDIDV